MGLIQSVVSLVVNDTQMQKKPFYIIVNLNFYTTLVVKFKTYNLFCLCWWFFWHISFFLWMFILTKNMQLIYSSITKNKTVLKKLFL